MRPKQEDNDPSGDVKIKKDVRFQYSSCCDALGIRVPIHLRGEQDREIGHVGLCGKCYQPYREPYLLHDAPTGYRMLWPTISRKHLGQRWAADVESKDGVLVPFEQRISPQWNKFIASIGRPEEKRVKWIEDDEVPF